MEEDKLCNRAGKLGVVDYNITDKAILVYSYASKVIALSVIGIVICIMYYITFVR